MITRAEMKYEIYLRLNKSAATKGFYIDTKVNSVIQECMDYITTKCFIADEGWTHKLDYIDTQANQVAVPIRPDISMILELRYLVGNIYVPLQYDQQWGEAQWAGTSGVVQFPSRWKMIDNNIYFNPALGVGGTGFLQLEYMAYPPRMRKDSDYAPGQFDRSMFWFTVYRSCRLLTGQVQQIASDWPAQEELWFNMMTNIIDMRTRQVIPIKDFDGF